MFGAYFSEAIVGGAIDTGANVAGAIIGWAIVAGAIVGVANARGGGALTFGKGRGVWPQNLKPYP